MVLHRTVLVFTFAIIASAALGDELAFPPTEDERAREVEALDWEYDEGQYTLPTSGSSIDLRSELGLVRGKDARRLAVLINGTESPKVEAVVVEPVTLSTVYFEYFDSGYITLDDWGDINPADMIESVRDATAEANDKRQDRNISELTVVGWSQEPTLDRTTKTVHWAIDALEDGYPIVKCYCAEAG